MPWSKEERYQLGLAAMRARESGSDETAMVAERAIELVAARDFYLSGKAMVDALTYEYRMTLDEPDSASPGHRIRVAIRSAAEDMGLALDEALLNTPLEE